MTVSVLDIPCHVLVENVLAAWAHPDDEQAEGVCNKCKMVLHPITWEPVLVWGFGDVGDYTVSRHDANFPLARDLFDKLTVH